jgi:hypothetical protein
MLSFCHQAAHRPSGEAPGHGTAANRADSFEHLARIDRLLGVFPHEAFELCLGILVLEVGLSGPSKMESTQARSCSAGAKAPAHSCGRSASVGTVSLQTRDESSGQCATQQEDGFSCHENFPADFVVPGWIQDAGLL